MPKTMANRHLSRSIVLQTLFEWDFNLSQSGPADFSLGGDASDPSVRKILDRNIKEFAPGLKEDVFALGLLDSVFKNQSVVDEIIEKAAPDWPIEKISIIDRNILRIGLSELLFGDRKEVPPKVAINEAIELAKTFGGENSGKFINGVLGAVYKELGEPGKEQVSKRKDPNLTGEVDISKLPVERKGGALVYSIVEKGGVKRVLLALVHDVFGYWTLSKGGIEGTASEAEATAREIKKELGLDVVIEDKLGDNEYVAVHPVKGKVLKKVVYFLARSEYSDLVLEKTGGLDGARWFELAEIPELRVYGDIVPIIVKAIELVNKKNQ